MGHSYEIEIKSLLGEKQSADDLVRAMRAKDPGLQSLGVRKHLNHYFVGDNLKALLARCRELLPPEKAAQFAKIAGTAQDFSLRTRQSDAQVFLVVKASIDDTTSSNGTARMEFENEFTQLSLEQLDQMILDAGFSYQAKWSREREEFKYKDITVVVDKNAGYGYMAEFEVVADDHTQADSLKVKLRAMMQELGVTELPQDRLGRMFDYYNMNWQEYYGTEKVFNIE